MNVDRILDAHERKMAELAAEAAQRRADADEMLRLHGMVIQTVLLEVVKPAFLEAAAQVRARGHQARVAAVTDLPGSVATRMRCELGVAETGRAEVVLEYCGLNATGELVVTLTRCGGEPRELAVVVAQRVTRALVDGHIDALVKTAWPA